VLSLSDPPYRQSTRHEMGGSIRGPVLVCWGSHWLVGGRRTTERGPRTELPWLENSRLSRIAELPSDGDNSYPGLVKLDDGRLLVSWYSSHEKDGDGEPITAIHVAELAMQK